MENQENEIIELAEYQPDEIEEYAETAEERSGMGTGLAMLIGGGLTLAGIAAWRFAKKKYDQFKARKDDSYTGVGIPTEAREIADADEDVPDADDFDKNAK